jgi:hypothetical protein
VAPCPKFEVEVPNHSRQNQAHLGIREAGSVQSESSRKLVCLCVEV